MKRGIAKMTTKKTTQRKPKGSAVVESGRNTTKTGLEV
jgi:hypothetical protein